MSSVLTNRLSSSFIESNLSLRELEAKTGIPKSSLQRYINGTTEKITNGRLIVLAEALNKPITYFLGVSDAELSGDTDLAFELAIKENFSKDPSKIIYFDNEPGIDLGKLALDIRKIFIDDFGIPCSIELSEQLSELLAHSIQTKELKEFLQLYVNASEAIRHAAIAVLMTENKKPPQAEEDPSEA